MNSVKLSSKYRLSAFSDYSSMKSALPYMGRVVLSNRLADVQARDIARYVERMPERGYKNYLEPLSHQNTLPTASRSFITALQMLYKSNGYSARYIVVERV